MLTQTQRKPGLLPKNSTSVTVFFCLCLSLYFGDFHLKIIFTVFRPGLMNYLLEVFQVTRSMHVDRGSLSPLLEFSLVSEVYCQLPWNDFRFFASVIENPLWKEGKTGVNGAQEPLRAMR